jgi:Copper transport outer membrane protein, MctB
VISLRHHLLTIVAVFLALAAGIVLGGGPLSEVTERTSAATRTTAAAEVPVSAAYGEEFAAAVTPTLLSGRLAERQVAVVTVPGADEQLVTALTEQVAAAGGTVSARVRLADALVDPAQKSLVDTLGSQLVTQQGDAVDPEASTYDRMGELLGLAVATTVPEGEDVTGKACAITDAAVGAEFVEQPEDVTVRAPLVLLVLGTDAGDAGSDAILAGLAAGLGRQALGVVVAGTTADGADGQLGRLRADPVSAEVATVDGIDTAAGRATTVLALARASETKGGAFGASGGDGPVPLG